MVLLPTTWKLISNLANKDVVSICMSYGLEPFTHIFVIVQTFQTYLLYG